MISLPDELFLSAFDGNWERYRDALFAIFQRDFMEPPFAEFQNLPVYYHPDIGYAGLPKRFWHLITDGENNDTPEEKRRPNLRRCEKLTWARALIDYGEAGSVPCWTEKKGRRTTAYMATDDFTYVVVLKRNPNDRCWYLATAYCPNRHRRQSLERRWRATKK